MALNALVPDFRDILVELADAEAELVLIGGWAKDLADVHWLENHPDGGNQAP